MLFAVAYIWSFTIVYIETLKRPLIYGQIMEELDFPCGCSGH